MTAELTIGSYVMRQKQKSVINTHTGIVITRDGKKRMKLHSTETS